MKSDEEKVKDLLKWFLEMGFSIDRIDYYMNKFTINCHIKDLKAKEEIYQEIQEEILKEYKEMILGGVYEDRQDSE